MTVNVVPPGRPCFCVTCLSTDIGTTAPQPLPRRNDEAITKIGGYWESTDARNQFAPSSPAGGMDIILSLRMNTLKDCINKPKLVKEIVHETNDKSELTIEETINYMHKATYLYYAYECALKHLGEDEKKHGRSVVR